jgi:hypothetical protein
MRIATGLLLVLSTLGVGRCSSGYPPLPGPAPNAEVVAVSTAIASADVPVFYVRDVSDPHRVTAYDWTGKRRGELVVSSSEPYGVYPSPDGTMILLTHAHVVSGGKAVGKVAVGTWAGDNAHVCAFLNRLGGPGAPRERRISANQTEGEATPGSLFLETITGQRQRVVDYGSFGEHGGPDVLACNAPADRVVIVQNFVGQQSNLEVLRLSDGQPVYQEPNAVSDQPLGLVASWDGSLLAEGSTASTWNGHDSFLVRQIPSGAVVAHISDGGAAAFSGDDARVLTVQYLNGGNQSGRYQVIDLATSRIIWSAVLSPGTILTRPHSSDFIVASRSWEPSSTRTNGNDPFEDLWLVPADGSPRLLLQHVQPLD